MCRGDGSVLPLAAFYEISVSLSNLPGVCKPATDGHDHNDNNNIASTNRPPQPNRRLLRDRRLRSGLWYDRTAAFVVTGATAGIGRADRAEFSHDAAWYSVVCARYSVFISANGAAPARHHRVTDHLPVVPLLQDIRQSRRLVCDPHPARHVHLNPVRTE